VVYAALKDRAIKLYMQGGEVFGVTRIAGQQDVRIRVVKVSCDCAPAAGGHSALCVMLCARPAARHC
jgi:hypothetical protein